MAICRNTAAAVLAGGLGGMINAALCYFKWPVPVQDKEAIFQWHVIPAGFLHGLLLVFIVLLAARGASRLSGSARWLIIPVIGWISGYLSWIPLDLSAFGQSISQALLWPMEISWRAVWMPFAFFGIVSALFYSSLIFRPGNSRAWWNISATVCAGVLGSLWWWIIWGPWYFSIIHGAIWGSLVGTFISRNGFVLKEGNQDS